MFKLEKYDKEIVCKELPLTQDLFHVALNDGERRYHVSHSKGELFDIVYYDNNDDLEPLELYPVYLGRFHMASYRVYDEFDKDTLYMEFFKNLTDMEFEELNEYTIAMTRVVLAHTDMSVYCTDKRIAWFVEENARLHIVDELPELPNDTTFYIQTQLRLGIEDRNFNRLSSVYAFHNVFFFQWLLDGRKREQFKYVTLSMGNTGGIGAVLGSNKRFERAFRYFNLKFISTEERIGKFKVSMLDKYFSLGLTAEDATKENTLVINSQLIMTKTKCIYCMSQATDVSILSDRFKEEMDEYYEALFEGRKVLGVLIRGTDYISSGLGGERLMATVPQMLPLIRQWMEEDQYDRIFLATEDEDIFEQMRNEFGKKMVVIAQKRRRVADFKKGQIISDLENEIKDQEQQDALIEDTTINYFYALYLLSKSDSFICSGLCNGWDVVNDFNRGKFLRSYKFNVDEKAEG